MVEANVVTELSLGSDRSGLTTEGWAVAREIGGAGLWLTRSVANMRAISRGRGK